MDSSSGKSTLRRLEICSGLQAFTQRRSARWGLPFRSTSGQAGRRVDHRVFSRRPTAAPGRSRAGARWWPSWPSWVCVHAVRRATGRSMPCRSDDTSSTTRCDGTPGDRRGIPFQPRAISRRRSSGHATWQCLRALRRTKAARHRRRKAGIHPASVAEPPVRDGG